MCLPMLVHMFEHGVVGEGLSGSGLCCVKAERILEALKTLPETMFALVLVFAAVDIYLCFFRKCTYVLPYSTIHKSGTNNVLLIFLININKYF